MTDAYTALAAAYDRLTADVGYEKWADYVERQFRKAGRPIRSVAELGCGTGSLTLLLAQRGYAVTAVDLSPDMLALAEQKCRGLGVRFLCQDMSRLTLLERTGQVWATCGALLSPGIRLGPWSGWSWWLAGAAALMARVYRALAPGGLFLFDVKTPSALEGADGQTYLDEDDGLFCVWRADYYPRRRVCSYGLDLFLRQEDGSWSRDGEYHEEYAYTMKELRGFLQDAGFQAVRLYGDKMMSAPKEGAQRVFFAAKKER